MYKIGFTKELASCTIANNAPNVVCPFTTKYIPNKNGIKKVMICAIKLIHELVSRFNKFILLNSCSNLATVFLFFNTACL